MYIDDLDYWLSQQPVNEFKTRGRMQRSQRPRRQNYVQQAPGAVSDNTRAATARFMRQYADLGQFFQEMEQAEQQRQQARRDPKAAINKQVQRYVDNAPKSSRAAIKARQRQLKEMGLYTGNIDGKWGALSKEAHNAAISNGAVYSNGKYLIKPDTDMSLSDKIDNQITKLVPAFRQLRNTLKGVGSGYTQTNEDFSEKYLENLSQLGQVAYRQYVRKHGYPSADDPFALSLLPSAYKEINPSGRYADFSDIMGLINAGIGGNRQVEFTDGAMSGTAYLGNDGMVHWNPTDDASWEFDPGSEERQKAKIKANLKKLNVPGALGHAIRLGMGNLQKKQDEAGYEPIKQNLDIVFPIDTIMVNPARYNNVPRYNQKR